MSLSKRFSTWKARRFLSANGICPKHMLEHHYHRDKGFGCLSCIDETHEVWAQKYRVRRAIADAKIADAKAKLAPIEEGTK